ncbi:MAG: hypothetical protein HY898_33270 [Deltaproteobacteria bacterium]|nr:hypothetical protein [Deltaproteobacteria bacterium]
MTRRLPPPIAWLLALALVLASGTAQAEVSAQDRAAARALFDQGRALVKAGKFDQACPKFEESYKLDAGIGAAFNLADCYEHVGKTASAWSGFLEAASRAKIGGQDERERVARERAQALEPRLTRLIISLPAGADDARIEVRRDGTLIGKGMWGQPVPVDPGEHTISASAAAHKPWQSKVEVAGEGKTVTIAVPALEREPDASQPAKKAPTKEPTAGEAPRPAGGGQRLAGIVVGGVGVVSLGLAGVFALQTRSKVSDAEAYCQGAQCWDQRGVDLHDEAKGKADLATVFGAIGAAGIVGGAVLYLTAPRTSSQPSEQPSTALVAGPMSLGMRGVW